MKQYINVNDLWDTLAEFETGCGRADNDAYDECLTAVIDAINEIPLADVAEVRHGKWVRVRFCKMADPDGGYWIVRCNQCNTPHIKEYNYCPTCGAKMEVNRK